jgi:alkylation response protein AidB-like acyl-CoA dehydrogenase
MRSPWQPCSPQPWPDSPPQDPYALTVYGELAVVARAASALAAQAEDALLRALVQGEDLADEDCAKIATRALDVIGVDAASARYGFDRFWRNARTHTLREPVTAGVRR